MASTTVRKQRFFISANSWSLLALLKMVYFCGGSVVPRHCWELVHQCRKECYSTMPTFDNFLALLIILLFAGGNVVLRRCWWLVHQCRKNTIQQCQLLMIFVHCFYFFYFPASRLYSALLIAGTTVPKQRFFISVKVWWLVALLKIVFFRRQCCNSALLRVLHQCRKECYSTMPIFNNFSACWSFYYLQAAMLYFGAVDG